MLLSLTHTPDAASYFFLFHLLLASRMSGITEWKNAIFLWVNVGDKGGDYTNLFERTVVDDGNGAYNCDASGNSAPQQTTELGEPTRFSSVGSVQGSDK